MSKDIWGKFSDLARDMSSSEDLYEHSRHQDCHRQGQGMLMYRYELSPHQSFAIIARESQDSNRKLRDIAADIVRNGVKSEYLR